MFQQGGPGAAGLFETIIPYFVFASSLLLSLRRLFLVGVVRFGAGRGQQHKLQVFVV